MLGSLLSLLLRDLVFLAILAGAVVPLCFGMRATFAVLKRNFVGYFSNPTGYVFLCLFVLLTSLAAFWPHEFFNSNLANLDQLNNFLPYVMLFFIPAITMAIWAEEKRQGTDELLLTLPAGDVDIVVGKYLAAASIFTASLLFSQLCNYFVLAWLTLGDLDTGLFFATYFGYWLVGMAMLSVGMVASFLTSNLTVGFILGAIFNAPLVFAMHADTIIPWPGVARLISDWSVAGQFDDFGRGVISLSATAYFVLVAVVGLYLSMVLIGARHWSGGRDNTSMLGHFLVRTFALVMIALGATYLCSNADLLSRTRGDLTHGNISSLSAETKQLMDDLDAEHTINIEAFISADVPEVYAKTKSDLIAMLKEFAATKKKQARVQIHILDKGSEDSIRLAHMAEERFGITPESVRTFSRGAIKDEEIFLAAAFTCGLDKIVVPLFDYGISVEYELMRSICTVAKKDRKKIGIVRTDAGLMGSFSMAGGRPQQIPRQPIVDELEKQYDVEEINATSPIDLDTYDVMIVAQPSSLGPEELDSVLEAIRAGQPTAIFEDPRPIFMTMAPATGEPKRPPPGMDPRMMQMQGPPPKGDIQKLWNLLGLDVPGKTPEFAMGPTGPAPPMFSPDLAWQRYNPYLKLRIRGIPDSWVFCREEAPGGEGCINKDSDITRGLEEIFFPVPGVIKPARDSELKFIKLVTTGTQAGSISYEDFMQSMNSREGLGALAEKQGRADGPQTIAVQIRGVLEEDQTMSDAGFDVAMADESDTEGAADKGTDEETDAADAGAAPKEEKDASTDGDTSEAEDAGDAEALEEEFEKRVEGEDAREEVEEEEKQREINVVYVADIDLLISTFLRIRARPDEDEVISWNFENVTFLLNIVDVLSGDDDYVEIRKRKPRHSTLKIVEFKEQEAREREFKELRELREGFADDLKKIEDENEKEIEKAKKKLDDMRKKSEDSGTFGIKLQDLIKLQQEYNRVKEKLDRRKQVQEEKMRRQEEDRIDQINREIDLEIAQIKNWYKFLAVALPPIPPLLVGLIVFARRRLREREGIAKTRMR